MRVVPINNDARTTGVNKIRPGQAVCTVGRPISNLISHMALSLPPLAMLASGMFPE